MVTIKHKDTISPDNPFTCLFYNKEHDIFELTKADVELGNVDNTSDADKPISDDTQEALDLKLDINDVPSAVVVDTEVNILSSSASTVKMAYSSDTHYMFYANGSVWKKAPFKVLPSTPNMGSYPDNNLMGIGQNPNYISDYLLSNCQIGPNVRTVEGAIGINGTYFQVYLNAVWNNIVVNFTLRECATHGYRLEHMPTGYTTWLSVNGYSDIKGLNGLPLVQEYNVSMGAYPVPLKLDGGGF